RPASRRAAACPERANRTTRNGHRGSGGRTSVGGISGDTVHITSPPPPPSLSAPAVPYPRHSGIRNSWAADWPQKGKKLGAGPPATPSIPADLSFARPPDLRVVDVDGEDADQLPPEAFEKVRLLPTGRFRLTGGCTAYEPKCPV